MDLIGVEPTTSSMPWKRLACMRPLEALLRALDVVFFDRFDIGKGGQVRLRGSKLR